MVKLSSSVNCTRGKIRMYISPLLKVLCRFACMLLSMVIPVMKSLELARNVVLQGSIEMDGERVAV